MPKAIELKIPRQIGPYVVEQVIGRGAFGRTYKAIDVLLDTVVVVKQLLPGRIIKMPSQARFIREIDILKMLDHEGVVKIIQGDSGEYPYYAMEYIEGKPLSSLIRHNPSRDDIDSMVQIFVKLCQAVKYCHDHGVVHRDIKPQNIMIRPNGEPCLIDFGLSFMESEEHRKYITMTGVGLGTLPYVSPEQAVDAKHVDNRSDIYSLGIVFLEMLTGSDSSEYITAGRWPVPHNLNSAIPLGLEEIILGMLMLQPEERYSDMAQVLQDLMAWQEGKLKSGTYVEKQRLSWRRARRLPKVGEVVTLGHYPQGDSSCREFSVEERSISAFKNQAYWLRRCGIGSINWLVLAKEKDSLLLMAENALDCMPFHEERADVFWENCSLRSWLNGPFLDTAFSEYEKSLLLPSRIDEEESCCQKIGDAPEAEGDKVFLLSAEEVEKYLSQEQRACQPSKFCRFKLPSSKFFYWWLRTPGSDAATAARIDPDGKLDEVPELACAGELVDAINTMVRPALRIKI